ncbi:hypothetical protein [Sulfuriroseicoccus oceanibius]|uniref:Uncharacterized protein n=1 Tax=Sulfuriroseicoccus oceanibius TaxID=2707525 RepID=A0A6B3L9H9_9BACT|nr:hypothetical protein [Sulfuriroseicoccus oceanibius]QQL46158.1 hypothetical protein G3M56_006140 [Sulfuriroseicoccus oceanibius]
MFKKLFKLSLVAAILWTIGSVVYYLAAESKARALMLPVLGEKYSVAITPFDDYFLQKPSRAGFITVTDKQNNLRQAKVSYSALGRFYPQDIAHGSLMPLLSVVDRATVDKIGRRTVQQRARDGISTDILND